MKRSPLLKCSLILLTVSIAPAQAQPTRGMPAAVDAAESALLPELAALVSSGEPNVLEADALLAKLPRPTPIRGFVQAIRARLLLHAGRGPEAKAAAEEGVRLAPGKAFPLMIASHVLTFSGAADSAADYWLEASVLDPDMARRSDPYLLSALVGRLKEVGDVLRADRVQARMDEIGLAHALAPQRSEAALSRVRVAFKEGGAVAARPLIAGVLDPSDLRQLYIDRRYEALWPAIDDWAGSNFMPMQRRYLEELRREFWTQPEGEGALNYARELAYLRQYGDVVTLFLPLLSVERMTNSEGDTQLIPPVVARALKSLGRRPEAMALLARAVAAVPVEEEMGLLNPTGNIINQEFFSAEWEAAAKHAAEWLAIARRQGPGINRSAVVQVESLQACALIALGRAADASVPIADVIIAAPVLPSSAMTLYTCQQNFPAAKKLVIESLANPATRDWALTVLQPTTVDPGWSVSERAEHDFQERLRRDVAIRAAAEKVGRLLPVAPSRTVPQGFDTLQKGPARKPVPGSI